MFGFYVDTLLGLAKASHGLPLLAVSTLTSVVFVLAMYPVAIAFKKVSGTRSYRKLPVLHMLPVNNFAFNVMFGFPLLAVFTAVFGVNFLALMNVIMRLI